MRRTRVSGIKGLQPECPTRFGAGRGHRLPCLSNSLCAVGGNDEECVMEWDAHAEHKEAAEAHRERFRFVLGNNPTRTPTVRKHEAMNWVSIKSVYEEALEKCPRAADTIAWFLWWDIGDADRLAELTKPDDDAALPSDAGEGGIVTDDLLPLPCPFCGRDSLTVHNFSGRWSVSCGITGCYGSAGAAWTREDAIRAWNTRRPAPSTEGGE